MSKHIYIMLSMTGTRFSRFLKYVTKAKYSHVSLSLDRQLTQLYSFGRRNPYLPFIAGFVREDPNSPFFQKYNPPCLIYEIPVTDEEYREITKMIEEFKEDYDRYHYNFAGLPLMAMNIPLKRRWHFVCSQFVAYLVNKSGVVQFEKDFSLVRPEDFCTIEEKKPIYEGNLKGYLLAQLSMDSSILSEVYM